MKREMCSKWRFGVLGFKGIPRTFSWPIDQMTNLRFKICIETYSFSVRIVQTMSV
jgi:hypothetical protein